MVRTTVVLFHNLPSVINHGELITEIETATALDWSAGDFGLRILYNRTIPVTVHSIRVTADDSKIDAIQTAIEAHASAAPDYSAVDGIELTQSITPHIIKRVDTDLPTEPKEVSSGGLISTSSSIMAPAISTTIEVVADDLIFCVGTLQVSADAADGTVNAEMVIDGDSGQDTAFKEPTAPNTTGNASTLFPNHFITGASGTITVSIGWSVAEPETAYSASRRINIFKTKAGL